MTTGPERIAVLDNEVQAQMLHAILVDRGIPHAMQSYHSRAYDGLFQLGMGWGHVEAPPEHREEILRILEDMDDVAEDDLEKSTDDGDTPPPPPLQGGDA
jgi:hypothetical protein